MASQPTCENFVALALKLETLKTRSHQAKDAVECTMLLHRMAATLGQINETVRTNYIHCLQRHRELDAQVERLRAMRTRVGDRLANIEKELFEIKANQSVD